MILTLLAILALPLAFISGGVAFSAWRAGESGLASRAVTVFAICVVLYVAAPKTYNDDEEDFCRRDWDGRSNPIVCD